MLLVAMSISRREFEREALLERGDLLVQSSLGVTKRISGMAPRQPRADFAYRLMSRAECIYQAQ